MEHAPEFKLLVSIVGKMAQALRIYAKGCVNPELAEETLKEYEATMRQLCGGRCSNGRR